MTDPVAARSGGVTAFFLRNRHAVWALVVATVLFGLVAYRELPVRLFPDTAPPVVNVVTAWPGATASDVDQDLTDILAAEFAALEGVAGTSTTSQDNLSMVRVEFQYGTDVDLAAVAVDNAISRVAEDLPADAEQSRVMTFSTADRPVYTVGLQAEDLLAARQIAEDIVAPRLQAVEGVATVDVFGGQVPAVFIDVDPALAESHHISLPQVAAAVQQSNLSAPAGRLRGSETETMLRVDQRAQRVEQLGVIPLAVPDGGQLRVGDVATVRRGAEQDDSWFSVDGQRAIAVQVYPAEGANTVAVVAEVRRVVAGLETELRGVRFVAGEESASFTDQSVSSLLTNVWQALMLASAVLFLFLGRIRIALVTAFSMPLSFGLTFAVMWLLGMELNMVTLSAVILAVGMVVDASVVVLENIVRHRDLGASPEEAAAAGTDQVMLPVLAGVATTLVVLFPLLGLPGFVGRVFAPLATTLLIAFSSSVIVALVLVPILSLNAGDGGRVDAFAARLARPFQAVMARLGDGYLAALDLALRHRAVVLGLALLSFVGGVGGVLRAGMDVLPRMDSGAFVVSLETPSGTSLVRTTEAVQQVEAVLRRQPEVKLVQAQAGFESGMKFSGGSGVMGPTQGFVSVTLSPRTERERTIWEIQRQVRQELHAIPGIASLVVKEIGNTAKPTVLAPIVARVSGLDPLVLDQVGDLLVERLAGVESVVAPTRTWRRDMRRVLVSVDERQAAAYGQSPQGLARQLAAGAEGIPAGTWSRELASAEPIQVRFARTVDPDIAELLSWPAQVPGTGEIIPLRAFAADHELVEQGLFTSEDRQPVLDVLAQVDGRPLSFVVADVEEALADLVLPVGYRVSIEGENNDLIESRVSILRALGVSVLAVYLLLVAQFRSWLHPLTVMMAVPLSLAGVSLALTLAGKPVSMPVMVGLVLLVGTVVNNSILLVDSVRTQRDEGVERREALRESVRSRFRPIMMTSLSTVIGMLPLAMEWALGSERFSPLATAVIGGLLASTLLTLIVIPVLYDLVDGLRLPGMSAAVTPILTALVVAVGALGLSSTASAQAMTLDEAWVIMREHPAAVAAELQVDAARARSGAATARLLPQAELSARASRLSYVEPPLIEIPLILPDGSTPDPIQLGEAIEGQYALGLSVTQPVFAGGALVQARRAARAEVDVARAHQDGAEASLWLGLVAAWYGLAVADEVARIQGRVVDAARAREQTLSRLVAQGRSTELELSTVALRRSEAEQSLSEAQAQATLAFEGLAALLGGPSGPVEVDVVADAMRRSVDLRAEGRAAALRAADAQAQAAQARALAVAGQLSPAFALRFGATHANPNSRYFPLQAEWHGSWEASAILTWQLDAGLRWQEARAARLQAQAAEASRDALERQTQIDLRGAWIRVELAPTQLGVAAERVRVSGRAVEAAAHAVEQGRLAASELLDREADLARASAAEQRVALEVLIAVERARTLAGHAGPAQ